MKTWLLMLVIFIAGCTASKTQQHSLLLLPASATTPIAENTKPILVVSTNLDAYLDQVSLIYRVSETQIVLTKHNSWAQQISDQINQRVIANLRAQQTSYWPVALNSSMKLNTQPKLLVHLSKFNGAFTGEAELSGEWSLIDAQGALIKSDYFQINKPLKEEGYDQLVISLAQGIDDFSGFIAEQLSAL